MATQHRKERKKLKAHVRRILCRECVGSENAITSVQLFCRVSSEWLVPGKKYDQTRILRSVINELRQNHSLPIVGNNVGYFVAKNLDEFDPYLRKEIGSAKGRLCRLSRMAKMPLPDMLRQYDFLTPQDLEDSKNGE